MAGSAVRVEPVITALFGEFDGRDGRRGIHVVGITARTLHALVSAGTSGVSASAENLGLVRSVALLRARGLDIDTFRSHGARPTHYVLRTQFRLIETKLEVTVNSDRTL